MREKDNCCQKPKELKGKPQGCSPKQIKKCHAGVKKHPCAPRKTCCRPDNAK